ncbi:DUF4381 domain-containing protein [Pseudomonas sp.]|uniref:DUF4381 domain-containing protein n=1 Tax=Pseudomonas sp. TaxID=306 RepID=UPI001B18C9B3|nr:DUF4381 domain-containing protein [Pseudomonas sp.]MBO9549254.1 DUF4381 domain-containing protein [Pseudomonas sp.]
MTTPVQPSLDQLRELVPGTPPFGYWPQTWAWALLLVLLLAVLTAWAARRWWHWRRDLYRREALLRLDQLAAAPAEQRLAALRELPELLKRVALSMPGTPAVAGLGGEAWQQFMSAHARQTLPQGFSTALQQLAYAPDAQLHALDEATRLSLFSTSRAWIASHHVAL